MTFTTLLKYHFLNFIGTAVVPIPILLIMNSHAQNLESKQAYFIGSVIAPIGIAFVLMVLQITIYFNLIENFRSSVPLRLLSLYLAPVILMLNVHVNYSDLDNLVLLIVPAVIFSILTTFTYVKLFFENR